MTGTSFDKDAMPLDQPDRLRALAASLGESVPGAANRPIAMTDPGAVWFVEEGGLDVFIVEYRDGEPASSLKHLLRVGEGRFAFGVAAGAGPLGVIAKGLQGSRIRCLRLDDLPGRGVDDALAEQADAWLLEYAAAVARQIEPRPRAELLVGAGESLEAQAGSVLSGRPGAVVWVDPKGAGAYLGTEDPDQDGTGLVPLTSDTWLTLRGPVRVTGVSSRELSRDGVMLQALGEFHRLALGAEQLNRLLLLADEANEQTARAAHRRLDEERARASLFSVLGPARAVDEESGSALLAALQVVGGHESITFRPPPRPRGPDDDGPSLQDILGASRVRARQVRLTSEERWWIGDSGAMLGFLREDGRPVALLPSMAGSYRVVDPASGRTVRLNARQARDLDEEAWVFYRPLPADEPVAAGSLLRFALKNLASDWAPFAVAGLLASALALAPAVMIGMLADWVLPAGAGDTLARIAAAIAVLAVAGTLILVLHGTALMRLEGRATSRVGAAIWDRLLNLPTSFFRRFTAGDLTVRMAVFWTLRDQVSGVAASALLGTVFLLPALVLLFLLDATLAWTSLGIGVVALAVTALFGLLQIGPQRRHYAAGRRMAGDLFQFIHGMSKLRAAGAEASAFASWARGYREQVLARRQIDDLNKHLIAFSAAVPAIAGAALFAVASRQGLDQLAVGDFLVVYMVSMVFYGAVVGLGRSFEALASAILVYEQIEPVLAALPESRPAGAPSVKLGGEVHFDHISFRYSPEGPLILDDVSIDARPGEFVAIVGESGAGKTTLLRMALGLEPPTGGAVYYDGLDLANLDRSSVRRQIGVVVQDGALRPGNVLDNIIGEGDDLTIDDAWRAARLADVAEDIAAMPMEMFTVVGDGVGTFSGGQMQRIMLAAALVRNPQVVLLDEATSWLDANSQARVMQGIESLAATRIVIAHRLSTIRKAERIYVLQAGRVVQQGGFDDLYETDGPFRQLVQRQMA